MNKSNINKRDKAYGETNIDSKVKPNTQIKSAMASRSSYLNKSPIVNRKATKSSIQGSDLQESWAVQPTEQSILSRISHSSVNKSNERQNIAGKQKRSFTKIQRTPKRISPKEMETPKPCLQYEQRYQTSQDEFVKDIIDDYSSEMVIHKGQEQKAYDINDEKPVFRLNSETLKEIEALGGDELNLVNFQQRNYSPNNLPKDHLIGSINDNSSINVAEESHISSLLSSRTEELLRSNKKPRRQSQRNKEKG